MEMLTIEVTSNAIDNAPMLPELMVETPASEPITSVSANGAYDTRGCLYAIARRGAEVVIPPRKNISTWKRASLGWTHRDDAVQACKHLGERI